MSSVIAIQSVPGRGRTLPVSAVAVPPFPLVAAHFALAFLWALAGAAGLVRVAPTMALGTFLDPRVLALTHTFTLGFLTTVIMGVLYQIYPAMLGVACRSVRVAWWSLGAQTAGTLLLVCGLLTGQRHLLGIGWSALFLATFGIAWNVLPGRRRAQRNREIGAYVSYAHTAFGFAMAIGLVRIGDGFGWWTTPRLPLLAAHFQFAAVGFGSLTAMGVGSRMIPMFLGVERGESWSLTWIPRITLTGTVVFGLGALTSVGVLAWIGAALMAAGALLYLRLAQDWYNRSRIRGADATLILLVTALASLAAAIPFGFGALEAGLRLPGLQAAYPALLVLGWLGGLIIGVSYRILPNLTWQYRFASGATNPNVPGLGDLVSPRLGRLAALAYTAGLLVFLPALVFSAGALARIGAALLFAGLLGTLLHHGRLFRPTKAREGTGARPAREGS
ncbi:MAG TPA: hypothetical protein VG692_14845 [Gemmatimonadales bacterium]|nr:hypothetical protein [Gemmatimonadales bacterium]